MKIATLATLVLGVGLSGCQMIARDYYFRIVVVNLGQERITENQVLDSTDEYNYGAGIMSPSNYANNAGPMSSPPNDVFTVRWKDAQGQKQEQKFDLRERVKRNFKGEIVFVYKADKTLKVEIVNPPERYPIPPQRPQ
jgi:hypothetical protein